MDYKPYDEEKVITYFGPPTSGHRVRGLAEQPEITFNSDFGDMLRSVDNENRHVDISDRSGTITVSLMAHSATNAAFTAFVAANVPIPVTQVDKSTNGDVFFAGSVKIKTMPSKKGKENKTWVWQFTKGTMIHAGAAR